MTSDLTLPTSFSPMHQNKLTPCVLGFRLTYKAIVRYVNRWLAGQLTIISNSDISMVSGFDLIDETKIDSKLYETLADPN